MPARPADPTALLRIATRIHHGLLRYLETGIDVSSMLSSEAYAREVLYVCEGSGDEELQSLARQFELERAARLAQPRGFDESLVEEDDGREPVGSAPIDLDDALLLPPRPRSWFARWWRPRRR